MIHFQSCTWIIFYRQSKSLSPTELIDKRKKVKPFGKHCRILFRVHLARKAQNPKGAPRRRGTMKTLPNVRMKSARAVASLTGPLWKTYARRCARAPSKKAKAEKKTWNESRRQEERGTSIYIRKKTSRRERRGEQLRKGWNEKRTRCNGSIGRATGLSPSPKIINLRVRPGEIIKRVPWLRARARRRKKERWGDRSVSREREREKETAAKKNKTHYRFLMKPTGSWEKDEGLRV